jgi:23S rRNA (cytosine1962-C5)-methyltransferase
MSVAQISARVQLRPGKAARFYARHPWVYDTAVARLDGEPADGDVVDIVNEKHRFVARGVFNGHSRLIVRLYSWDENEPLDEAFWRRRLEQAIALRRRLGYGDPAGAERLVFSEADGLSGLVVDRYAEHLVVQVNALAIERRLPMMLDRLQELQPCRTVTIRSDEGISKHEGMRSPDKAPRLLQAAGVLDQRVLSEASSSTVVIVEHGIRYQVDLSGGHKTGWYLDQRENRVAAARYLRGARVLDLFCYAGGFSLAGALLGQAREVVGVDSSVKAIEAARLNAELNGVTNVRFEQQDCFEALDAQVAAGERYDAVILDPPKFTRSRKMLDEALRAYHRINRLAVELLVPGGILVTCSCSGSVTREDFFDMLSGVAQKARRTLQVLEQRGAAPDHPVSTACPETEYLKCFICRVT